MTERWSVDLSSMTYSDQAPGFGENTPNSRGASLAAAVKKEGMKKKHARITVVQYLPIAHLRFIRFAIDFNSLPPAAL
jgi:hypothetical protein